MGRLANLFIRPSFHPVALLLFSLAAAAEDLPEIEVYLPSPLLGGATDGGRATTAVRTLEESRDSVANDLSDRLTEQIPSLHGGDVQNNPFQRDISFRGYTASPLLGSPQGVAVYQNGIRTNEVFGDTVEWDTIPDFAADTVQVVPGANPVFGLNALGGTLALQMKDGFNFRGGRLTSQLGSFGRKEAVGEYGLTAEEGKWGSYIGARYADEDGWRDDSPSHLRQGYGSVGGRGQGYGLDLDFTYANNDLIGNGAVPAELMSIEGRRTIFTSPDITRNELFMTSLGGFYEMDSGFTMRARLYYKDRKRPTLNGDEFDAEECDLDIDGDGDEDEGYNRDFLCDDDGVLAVRADDGGLRAYAEGDVDGNDYDYGFEGDYEEAYGEEPPAEDERWGEFAAVNRSNTESEAHGMTLQGEWKSDLSGYENFLIAGASYDHGETDYSSDAEIGIFADDRSVVGAHRKIAAAAECEDNLGNLRVDGGGVISCADDDELGYGYVATKADTENDYWGFYFTDALNLSDALTLELSGRYNRAEIELKDKSGVEPQLNGKHTFKRFNPAVGMSYGLGEAVTIFGSYREANRAPTPAELSCADEDDPCRFPNAFVADPPLKQVVNRTVEVGGRGDFKTAADHFVTWQASLYGGENRDDIIFIGGRTVGTGYFKNAGETRRLGAELALSGYDEEGWDWGASYSFVKATFESEFLVDTTNHPRGEEAARVRKGNDIPGIPRHQLKAKLGYMLTADWRVEVGASYTGSQYYRGDEANLLSKLDGYWLANVETSYALDELLLAFLRLNNLFNHNYESFGVLGNADEVFNGEGAAPYDRELGDGNRFVGPGTPLTVLGGVTIRF